VPFRRIDDRIRELCSRVVARSSEAAQPAGGSLLSEWRIALQQQAEQLRKIKLARKLEQPSHQGRCERLVHPDGRVYWSYTWSAPTQDSLAESAEGSSSSSPSALPAE
jgi:hypothetical protein